MKELSTEEKAKRFDEALERARELMSCCKNNRDRKTKIYRVEDIESIFPELKDSEDERIRKELLDYLRNFIPHHDDELVTKSKEWIDWLEN